MMGRCRALGMAKQTCNAIRTLFSAHGTFKSIDPALGTSNVDPVKPAMLAAKSVTVVLLQNTTSKTCRATAFATEVTTQHLFRVW